MTAELAGIWKSEKSGGRVRRKAKKPSQPSQQSPREWNHSAQVGCSSFPLAGCRAAVPPITPQTQRQISPISLFAAKPFHFNQLSISLPIRKRREMELMKWIGQRRYIGPLSRGETKPKSFDWFHSIKQIKDSFNFTSSNQIDCCLRYHRGSWCQYNNYCYNIFSIHSTSETKWKENLIY